MQNREKKTKKTVFQGIVDADSQTEDAIKHRINSGDKANNAKDQTVVSINQIIIFVFH